MINKVSFVCMTYGLFLQAMIWTYFLLLASDGYSTIHYTSVAETSEGYSFLIFTLGILFSAYMITNKPSMSTLAKSTIVWLTLTLETLLIPQDLRVHPGNSQLLATFLIFFVQTLALITESKLSHSNEK